MRKSVWYKEDDRYIVSRIMVGLRESDGFYDIRKILSKWKTSIFNYVSENLLARGYRDKYDGGIDVSMLVYLLNQSLQIVRFGLKKQGFDNSYVENLNFMHDFFSGEVMHYNGERERIVIVKNNDNGYAIMLPSDLTTLETRVKLPFKNLFYDKKAMKRLARFKK